MNVCFYKSKVFLVPKIRNIDFQTLIVNKSTNFAFFGYLNIEKILSILLILLSSLITLLLLASKSNNLNNLVIISIEISD